MSRLCDALLTFPSVSWAGYDYKRIAEQVGGGITFCQCIYKVNQERAKWKMENKTSRKVSLVPIIPTAAQAQQAEMDLESFHAHLLNAAKRLPSNESGLNNVNYVWTSDMVSFIYWLLNNT